MSQSTLRILVPKGVQGAYFSSMLSKYPDETELLLNAGTRFMKVGEQGDTLYFAVVQQGIKAKESAVNEDKFTWGDGDLVFENETGEKGSAASGNWAHTSFNRIDVWKGGSDPSGTLGGGLAALGLDKDSTPEERRAASAEFRERRTWKMMERMIDAKRVIVANPVNSTHLQHEASEWADPHYAEWYDSLSTEERGALHSYTGSGYREINRYWRKGPGSVYPDRHGVVKDQTEQLDSALSRAVVPEDVVVTRGVSGIEAQRIFATEPGGTFVDKGFGSTSVAQEWPWGDKTVRILVPQGANGGYVSSTTKSLGLPDECELLLARGARYMVLSKSKETIMNVEREVAYVVLVNQGNKAKETAAHEDKFVWDDESGGVIFEKEKGSAASGNWAHTSFNRIDVGKGGSDRSGTFGGGLASLGLDKDSTVEERRQASAEFREDRSGKVTERLEKARHFEGLPSQVAPLAKEWATEQYAEWYDSLTEGEVTAIKQYTGSGYKHINRYWRKGPGEVADYYHTMVTTNTPIMDGALERAVVPEDVFVARGVSGSTMQEIFSHGVGETFTDKGFGSTSLCQEWGWGDKTVRILVPKGARGAFVSTGRNQYENLGVSNESELLLPRGTRYMILDKRMEDVRGSMREVAYIAVVSQGHKEVGSMEWGQKPYTLDNPPPRISGLPEHAKRIWISAFNSAFEQYNGSEQKANAVAWSAVKRKYHKEGDQWVANKEVVRAAKGLDRAGIFAEKHNLDLEHVGVPIPFVFDHNVMGTVTVVKYADQEGRDVWRGFLDFADPIPYGTDLLHAMTVGMKGEEDIDAALDLAHEQLVGDEKTFLALSDAELEELYTATQVMLDDSIKSLASNLSPEQMGIVLDKVVEIVGEKGDSFLEARKGSAASGNWLHTSFNRQGVGRGGSDPAGAGGSLGKLGLEPDSTVEERREVSVQLRQERAEGKEPTAKKPKFPTSLGDLEKVKHLGGSTGAVLVRDPETGERYVRKRGANPEHIQEESTADQVYQALGVQVPEHQMYDDPEGPTKLARFIEGRSLNDVRMNDADQFEQVRGKLKEDFAADALLGNWDVVGLDYDNVLVDSAGNPWRIDNGGSLRFRAMGKRKTAQQWNEKPMELWTLRDSGTNKRAASIFGDLSFSDVVGQLERVGARRQTILNTVPRELRGVIEGRLDAFASIVGRAQELRQTGMGWDAVDEAVQTWMAGQ
jgi:cation transport regulator ChaB